jgi:hypothetical protein
VKNLGRSELKKIGMDNASAKLVPSQKKRGFMPLSL